MNKNTIKCLIIAAAAIIIALWFATEILHVLPAAFLMPLRLIVCAAAVALLVYVNVATKGKGGKGR